MREIYFNNTHRTTNNDLSNVIKATIFSALIITSSSHLSVAQDISWGAGEGGMSGVSVSMNQGEAGDQGNEGTGGKGGGTGGGDGGAVGVRIEFDTSIVSLTGGRGAAGLDAGLVNPSGGGGGGGAAVLVLGDASSRVSVSITGTIFGGDAGAGGQSNIISLYDTIGSSGGEGGAGLYSVFADIVNEGHIWGGMGGKGGSGNGVGTTSGSGGTGGAGVILYSGSGLINANYIAGGDAGYLGDVQNGSTPGSEVMGGAAVIMYDNNGLINEPGANIISGHDSYFSNSGSSAILVLGDHNRIVNGGTIAAVNSNSLAIAIRFMGAYNELSLQPGSDIIGRVQSSGEYNILSLSGDEVGWFNVENIGVGAQYNGFDFYRKSGSGRWNLSGTSDESTPWIVREGTLSISNDRTLGNDRSTLTLDGGKLELIDNDFDDLIEIYRPIVLTDRSGTINTVDTDAVIFEGLQGTGTLIKFGAERLILAGDSTYTGGTLIYEGELHIGFGGTSGQITGPITVEEDAELIFNRSDEFSIYNNIEGEGDVRFIGSGHAVWYTQNSDFDGEVDIDNGTLTIMGSLDNTIYIFDGAILAGSPELVRVGNEGTISPGKGADYGAITITDLYRGVAGSRIFLKAALQDDNSETDSLFILGDSVGTSNVVILNMAGTGGDTVKGIEVISVGGNSDAIFTLTGDYNLPSGIPAVIGGSHSYVLQKGSADDATDGNWYLRSNFNEVVCPVPAPGVPTQPCSPCPVPDDIPDSSEECPDVSEIYQPGVPLYSAYGQIIASLNQTSTLQERVGTRYWHGSDNDMGRVADPTRKEISTDAGVLWSRIDATHTRARLHGSTTENSYDSDWWNIRTGIDRQLIDEAGGRVFGSIWLGYQGARADVSSFFGTGDINVNTYGAGGALTWLADDDWYVDGQFRYSWTKSDINSKTLNRTLVTQAKGNILALSLEAGKQISMNDNWLWIPQAQLSWAQTVLDDFIDPYNARVSFDTIKFLTARLGMAAQYTKSWQDVHGYTTRSSIYSLANIYNELLGEQSYIEISNEHIHSGHKDRTWGELGLGGSYSFLDNKYTVFGDASVASSFKEIRKEYSLRGNVGLRVRW